MTSMRPMKRLCMKKLKKHYENSTAVSQRLDPPMILSLTMHEEEALNRYMDQFKALGFEIDPFGGREYAVRQRAFGTLRLYGKRSVY